MPSLVQVHVLPVSQAQQSPNMPPMGTRLLGLDAQGRLWCGFLMGEAGASPSARWTMVKESN